MTIHKNTKVVCCYKFSTRGRCSRTEAKPKVFPSVCDLTFGKNVGKDREQFGFVLGYHRCLLVWEQKVRKKPAMGESAGDQNDLNVETCFIADFVFLNQI